MDYDELKDKYDSSPKTNGRGRLLLAGVVLVAAVAIAAVYFLYFQSTPAESAGTNEAVMTGLSSLGGFSDAKRLAKLEGCTRIDKTETEWTVSGCTDNNTIYLTLAPEYTTRICGGWVGQEIVVPASVFEAMRMKAGCLSIQLSRSEGGNMLYDACGMTLYLKDGCLI